MPEVSNLSNRYEIITDSPFNYYFITDNNVLFVAYFSQTPGYFPGTQFDNDVISFTFEPIGKIGETKKLTRGERFDLLSMPDERIKPTIQYILIEAMRKSPEKSIHFICEGIDQKEQMRNRLFGLWHSEVIRNGDLRVTKYDANLANLGIGSIFVADDNPHHHVIRDNFLALSDLNK
ncbi:DUF6169 family protein [Dyadobacter bucti]|uniref:DUF6169 family protein n=1 Tax=Dyadobacter bucti TaxID=2572203 RepID=UPI0011093529|nr:DUF6169 family protein [Dyadobacter bucti]